MGNFRVVARLKPVAIGFVVLLLSTPVFAQHYTKTNLITNLASVPPEITDPHLQNAWGLVRGPATPWWVSNNAGGTSTLYRIGANGAASIVPLNGGNGVIVPNAPSQQAPGSPTSVLFNGSPTDFLLAPGKPAVFIFVTEDGTISGWNPGVNLTTAVIKIDNSEKPDKANGAVYKGATIAEIHGKKFILAANFRSGRVDVFDTSFNQVKISEDAFENDREEDDDRGRRDFAPFNVQGIGPNIYFTYAKQDAAKHDPVGGDGLGFVNVFSPEGKRLAHLENGPWFNAPWGVVLAPGDFGEFSHAILVGQFRGGTISAFNPLTGKFIGKVFNPDGSTLNIDGLWALVFGNGGPAGSATTLFFTAGPDKETNGLFGTLTPVAAERDENDEQ
jgi:uncharacterized protein (TIGR03118 family)